jgi:hypothetical protein
VRGVQDRMACTTRFTIYSCLLYPFSVRRARTKNPGSMPGLLIIFPKLDFIQLRGIAECLGEALQQCMWNFNHVRVQLGR